MELERDLHGCTALLVPAHRRRYVVSQRHQDPTGFVAVGHVAAEGRRTADRLGLVGLVWRHWRVVPAPGVVMKNLPLAAEARGQETGVEPGQVPDRLDAHPDQFVCRARADPVEGADR